MIRLKFFLSKKPLVMGIFPNNIKGFICWSETLHCILIFFKNSLKEIPDLSLFEIIFFSEGHFIFILGSVPTYC